MSICRRRAEIIRGEGGAVAILFALLLVALLLVVALVVDLGLLYDTKRDLQTAADAGALAGAWELPTVSAAKSVAVDYAVNKNDARAGEAAPTTPYNGDPTKIEVVCTRTVQNIFARVGGHATSVVSARAVAQIDQWAGQALPFINTHEKYFVDPHLGTWVKYGKVGFFESLANDEYDMVPSKNSPDVYFHVFWENGVSIARGNKADVTKPVETIYDRGDNPVYLLSVSKTCLDRDEVMIEDNKGDQEYVALSDTGNLKNNFTIPLVDDQGRIQIVLLECRFDSFHPQGNDPALGLECLREWNIAGGVFPPATVSLIE
jgi:hypothetical protein